MHAIPNRTHTMLQLMLLTIKKDRDGDVVMKDVRPPMARVLFSDQPSTSGSSGSVFHDVPLPPPPAISLYSDSDEEDDDDDDDDSDDDHDDSHDDDYDATTQPYTLDVAMPLVVPGRIRVASM
jgi:hypothetical protein